MKVSLYIPVSAPGEGLQNEDTPEIPDFRKGIVIVYEKVDDAKEILANLVEFSKETLHGNVLEQYSGVFYGCAVAFDPPHLKYLYGAIGRMHNVAEINVGDVNVINNEIQRLYEAVAGIKLTFSQDSRVFAITS
ncbi:hypothetical protein ABC855_g2973 [[Candida] zeylanoides]